MGASRWSHQCRSTPPEYGGGGVRRRTLCEQAPCRRSETERIISVWRDSDDCRLRRLGIDRIRKSVLRRVASRRLPEAFGLVRSYERKTVHASTKIPSRNAGGLAASAGACKHLCLGAVCFRILLARTNQTHAAFVVIEQAQRRSVTCRPRITGS